METHFKVHAGAEGRIAFVVVFVNHSSQATLVGDDAEGHFVLDLPKSESTVSVLEGVGELVAAVRGFLQGAE